MEVVDFEKSRDFTFGNGDCAKALPLGPLPIPTVGISDCARRCDKALADLSVGPSFDGLEGFVGLAEAPGLNDIAEEARA